jgi:hypothetical protein
VDPPRPVNLAVVTKTSFEHPTLHSALLAVHHDSASDDDDDDDDGGDDAGAAAPVAGQKRLMIKKLVLENFKVRSSPPGPLQNKCTAVTCPEYGQVYTSTVFSI